MLQILSSGRAANRWMLHVRSPPVEASSLKGTVKCAIERPAHQLCVLRITPAGSERCASAINSISSSHWMLSCKRDQFTRWIKSNATPSSKPEAMLNTTSMCKLARLPTSMRPTGYCGLLHLPDSHRQCRHFTMPPKGIINSIACIPNADNLNKALLGQNTWNPHHPAVDASAAGIHDGMHVYS